MTASGAATHQPSGCPVCDQGRIRWVRVDPCEVEGYLCTECEAFWELPEKPTAMHFTQLSHAVRQRGLTLSQITLVWQEEPE